MTIRDPIELERENRLVVSLVQAMIGAVSPNMRAVSLEANPVDVCLHFLLQEESSSDREEIEDIVFELEALATDEDVSVCVTVSRAELAVSALPGRQVFGRKEQTRGQAAAE